tara:strand:+ start:1493 stop:2059 length:567 start_codon:yes stop_codon:yes gene_type:complete
MIRLFRTKSYPDYPYSSSMKLTALSFMLPLFFSTSCLTQVEENKEFKLTEYEKFERMIAQNRAVLEAERKDIELFIDSSSHKFLRNGLGMHISLIERGNGVVLDTGDLARVNSRVTSLKGYDFSQSKISEFLILRDNEMIWGVQEASLGSRRGDSLVLIIPAHLAHGLAGDLKTIPPLTPLVYYLRIL